MIEATTKDRIAITQENGVDAVMTSGRLWMVYRATALALMDIIEDEDDVDSAAERIASSARTIAEQAFAAKEIR